MNEIVGTIYKVRDGLFRARLLYPEASYPVEFFRQGTTQEDLIAQLVVQLGIKPKNILSQIEFQWELDHLQLFGCRTSGGGDSLDFGERLDDDKIQRVITECNALLEQAMKRIENLDEEYNALLSGGSLES